MTDAPNLANRVVALSMSPSNDLARLGFPPREFDRIVFHLCMRVIRARGRILYGGHLQDNSLTARMFEFTAGAYVPGSLLERGDAPKPFLHLLPLSEFGAAHFARLYEYQEKFGSFLETRIITSENDHIALVRRGEKLVFRSNAQEWRVTTPEELKAFSAQLPRLDAPAALTAMRANAHKLTDVRIVLGGKRGDLGYADGRDHFHGSMPGIYEEALYAIAAADPVPVVVLGGYGGAARDVAIDLGLIGSELQVPYLGEIQSQYEKARLTMRDVRGKIPERDREMMRGFASRDDCEELARDIVAEIARRIPQEPPQMRAQ